MNDPSSLTELTDFPEFCARAARDEEVFDQFRSHPTCQGIVETVNKKGGAEYLKLIMRHSPDYQAIFPRFQAGDEIGKPVQFSYRPSLFTTPHCWSPTTLRYIKVLSDLEHLFGSLDDINIVEIGGGYGGQCKIIADRFEFARYTLVDLPPALALARRYIEAVDVPNVVYQTSDQLPDDTTYDLVISNYAFSEIAREWQDVYLRKILRRAQRGYILSNDATHTWKAGQYSLSALQEVFAGAQIFAGKRYLSRSDRKLQIRLLVWGHTT